MGYFRIELGKNLLGIEHRIAWATPGQYTVQNNFPCAENGKNCGPGINPQTSTLYYQHSVEAVRQRLAHVHTSVTQTM